MNIKQLLLATALITSLSSTAMADISISGEAKANSGLTGSGGHSIEADITAKFKSGRNSVVAQIGLDPGNVVEQLYMTSKVAGFFIKFGDWRREKSELKDGGVRGFNEIVIKKNIGGVEFKYKDKPGPGGTLVVISGSIGGLNVSHKEKFWVGASETKVSGSIGDVDIAYHIIDSGISGGIDDSYTVKTSVQGIDLTYVNTTSDVGTSMNGFIGKNTWRGIEDAKAFGISTNIAGNKVTYKDIKINGDDSKELILTRNISSGATFEATYRTKDNNHIHFGSKGLDLELAVKF